MIRSAIALSSALLLMAGTRPFAQPAESFEEPVPNRPPAQIPFKSQAFTFARVRYAATTGGSPISAARANGWMIDYPEADQQLSRYLAAVTGLSVDPAGTVVTFDEARPYRHPMIYLVEPGYLSMSDTDVSALRAYLLGGGMLVVDDFFQPEHWTSFVLQLRRVLPDYELAPLSAEHEIFHTLFDFDEPPWVPGVAEMSSLTAAGKGLSGDAKYWGVHDVNGRLMVLICHDTDLGEGWEHADDVAFPVEFSRGRALPMGVNIIVYALTH